MIGISSPGFSMSPPKDIVEMISGHFKLWEIVAEGKQFLPRIKKELKELTASHELKLQVHAPISDVNISSLNPRMRGQAFEMIRETLDAAHWLGIETITIHPGYLSPMGFYFPEKAKSASIEAIRWIEKVNRAYGLTICLENMPDLTVLICKTPEEIIEHIEGTDLKFCFDIGHANTAIGLEPFSSLIQLMGNLHVHDNKGQHDQHLPIGEGTLDWTKAKNLLHAYQGNAIIECIDFSQALQSQKRLVEMGWS
ncbi:MAG: sugar phosphate isomerase/epimerase [Candidatus Thermoplasmatota archaeon]|nr:sugar phosphate isomerase/epimerase [Candidatus Thermoplasmatota archaeon]